MARILAPVRTQQREQNGETGQKNYHSQVLEAAPKDHATASHQ